MSLASASSSNVNPPTTSTSLASFHALSAHLNSNDEDTIGSSLEIEILPSALCPPGPPTIQRDGNCIGVPKTLLVSAYLHAVGILFGGPNGTEPTLVRSSSPPSLSFQTSNPSIPLDLLYIIIKIQILTHTPPQAAFEATSIIILLAPEHLTAANLRKRYLVSLDPPALLKALHRELRFLDSILNSPLHRHVKSPTLWSHRRWLLTKYLLQLYSKPVTSPTESHTANNDNNSDTSTATSIVSTCLSTILRAANHHPRNYHAFQHLRHLLQHTIPFHFPLTPMPIISLHIIPRLHEFCRDNHSDTSAWSALAFGLDLAGDEEVTGRVVAETAGMAKKWRWKGEAVGVFLRGFGVGGDGEEIGGVSEGELDSTTEEGEVN